MNMSNNKFQCRRWVMLVAALLSCIPLFNIIHILWANGVNNITNDNLLVVPLFDRLLSGSYDWGILFRDAFINGHFQLFNLAIQFAVAVYAEWNVYLLFGIGIFFAVLRVIFLYWSFRFGKNSLSSPLLLVTLFGLTFSNSQISTFEFDWNSVMVNLCFLGFAMGIWGMVKFKGRWMGFGIMALGGMIASWTSGSGVIMWGSFLLGMLLLGFRNFKYLISWLLFGVLISLPYAFYSLQEPKNNPYSTFPQHLAVFRMQFLVTSIGYPFAQEFSASTALYRGIVGIALVGFGLVVLFFKRREKDLIPRSAPALMLLTFSLFNIWQISIFRDFLVPFYSSYFISFWMGLGGLGLLILDINGFSSEVTVSEKKWWDRLAFPWVCMVGLVLSFFYLTSNMTYEDKSATLKNRSPVSASCLRDYRNAPTYCEKTALNWLLKTYDEYRRLAQKLEKHHWSVFSNHQKWYLQGDFILDSVRVQQTSAVPPVSWVVGFDHQPMPFTGFQHLNLLIPNPNVVRWSMTIPKNARKADLVSAIGICEKECKGTVVDSEGFEITIERAGQASRVLFRHYLPGNFEGWVPFRVSLAEFAGEEITLNISTIATNSHHQEFGFYRFPYMDITLDKTESSSGRFSEDHFTPSNTELSPSFPEPSSEDFVFDITNPKIWGAARMQAMTPSLDFNDTWLAGEDPILEYKANLDVCLSDYSHFMVKIASGSSWKNRELQIYYRLNHQSEFEEARSVKIPLIADGNLHSYSFDLRLLGLSPGTRLTGIRLDPILNESSSQNNEVKIVEFRLLKDSGKSLCL